MQHHEALTRLCIANAITNTYVTIELNIFNSVNIGDFTNELDELGNQYVDKNVKISVLPKEVRLNGVQHFFPGRVVRTSSLLCPRVHVELMGAKDGH